MNEQPFLSRWSRRKHRSREASAEAPAGVAGSETVARTRSDEAARGPDEQRSRDPEQRSREPEPRAREAKEPVPGAGQGGERIASERSDTPAPGAVSQPPGAVSQPFAAERKPLPPIESLTTASDFRPFMQQGVDALTRNSALKRLFADPHFNVMDGLDVYIDDYNKTEPIPPALLATLKQLHSIGTTDEAQDARPGDDPGATEANAPEAAKTTEANAPEAKTAEAPEAPEAQAPEAQAAGATAAHARLARSDGAGRGPAGRVAVRDEKTGSKLHEPSIPNDQPNDQPNPEEPVE